MLAAVAFTTRAHTEIAENTKYTSAELFKNFTSLYLSPESCTATLECKKHASEYGNRGGFLQLSDITGDSQFEAI